MSLASLYARQADLLDHLTAEGRAQLAKLTSRQLATLERAIMALKAGDLASLKSAAMLALTSWLAGHLDKLGRLLAGRLRKSWIGGGRQLADLLGQLDQAFLGDRQAYPWDAPAWYTAGAEQHAATRAQPVQVSLARYAQATTAKAEEELSRPGLAAAGAALLLLRKRVWKAIRQALASTSWLLARLWDTETSRAYNAGRMAGMLAEDQRAARPGDRLAKQLVATFDKVTGRDSVILHGQTVPVRSPFVDVTGRLYDHPPNRPHDREIVVPTRLAYAAALSPYQHDQPAGPPAGQRDRRGVIAAELVKRREQLVRLERAAQATQDASAAGLLQDQLAVVGRQIRLLESQLAGT